MKNNSYIVEKPWYSHDEQGNQYIDTDILLLYKEGESLPSMYHITEMEHYMFRYSDRFYFEVERIPLQIESWEGDFFEEGVEHPLTEYNCRISLSSFEEIEKEGIPRLPYGYIRASRFNWNRRIWERSEGFGYVNICLADLLNK